MHSNQQLKEENMWMLVVLHERKQINFWQICPQLKKIISSTLNLSTKNYRKCFITFSSFWFMKNISRKENYSIFYFLFSYKNES